MVSSCSKRALGMRWCGRAARARRALLMLLDNRLSALSFPIVDEWEERLAAEIKLIMQHAHNTLHLPMRRVARRSTAGFCEAPLYN